jgi:Pumilio-family RNA binding repeat
MSTTRIQVVIAPGGEPQTMDIPLELACSLIIGKGGVTDVYTMQDVINAHEALVLSQTPVSTPLISMTTPSTPPPAGPPPGLEPNPDDLLAMSVDPRFSAEIMRELEDVDLRHEMIVNLAPHTYQLSLHGVGCRVVQKILEVGNLQERILIGNSLPKGKVVECCMDVNANHVMQKFIEVLPSEETEFIISEISSAFSNNVSRLAVHCYGCRVVQRILSRCEIAQTYKILDSIISHVDEMVSDQFGNYVVQHAIEYGREQDREAIIDRLARRDLITLACNKFASNVIEKSVRCVCSKTRTLVDALCNLPAPQQLQIMRDKYGNYVVRAFLELPLTEYPQLIPIKEILKDNSSELKKVVYSWHLIDKLQKSSSQPPSSHHRGL